jgi:hypothetical protein
LETTALSHSEMAGFVSKTAKKSGAYPPDFYNFEQ